MSLKEYKRKRDFKKTPEPSGEGAKNAPGREFVIQKHAARRLHYDFRLELGGTLKSWAVPKGPSLDPAVKALAVQVEDHPLDYAAFEGVIPQGEYGGGTVMVWDRGTWEPETDPVKGLKQGKLKFRLNGEKLGGSWALVRMGGRAGDDGKNWLLIKHRDREARPNAKSDILTRKQRSVITGRTMEEIAKDADRVWSSNGQVAAKSRKKKAAKKSESQAIKRPRASKNKSATRSPVAAKELAKLTGAQRAKQPAKFSPQLATLASEVPTGDDWVHELKFDGYRALAFFENGKVRLISRNGNDWTARFQAVADALATLPIKHGILDGEVVSLDASGVSNFQQLQNQMKRGKDESLVIYLFDVPHLLGYDLTQTPLLERKQVLARLVLAANPKNDGPFRYSDHIQGHGDEVLQQACRGAMEGIIAKRDDSAYQQARSSSWLKVKCLKQQEFVIGGFTKPEGSRVGFGALLLGYYENGELIHAGKVGTGFTTQSLRDLTAELKKRRVDSSPFKTALKGSERRRVTWVKPELVCEVEFTEWTSDGRLRHPAFLGLREDKPAKEVVRETPKPPAAIAKNTRNSAMNETSKTPRRRAKAPRKKSARSKKANASKSTSSNGAIVAGVNLTNPDRVLYPEQGITKRHLAEYYEQIADWILPYVVKRPLTLVRCPEGYQGECFFQKHFTGSLPDAVRAVIVPVKGKREEYVAVDDIAGVVALVQMGVLEMHPWPAREDELERPDMIVFDLDPGEGVQWKGVVEGAREVRDRLDAVGIESYLRVSGGKGLHVVVPIARRNSWDELKQFAKAVADTMTRDAPGKYIATLSKAKRRGKVFVDYLRNQRGATAIASYSTRRRAGAPVAVPLAWDELSTQTKADMYNIMNLPKRLDRLRSDPWEGFFSMRQSITRKVMAAFT